MIFVPGFSTASRVDDVAGRGVGMDVVRRNIEMLHGRVEIDTTPGVGTRFLMRLPLTLAIIDGMIVRVGGQRYVIPTLSIEQSIRLRPESVRHVGASTEVIDVRGSVVPIYRLAELFGHEDGTRELGDGIVVVLDIETIGACLFVDEVVDQQQIVIKSLGLGHDAVRGVSGGAIMGDGRVALILDVESLIANVGSRSGMR